MPWTKTLQKSITFPHRSAWHIWYIKKLVWSTEENSKKKKSTILESKPTKFFFNT